MDGAMIKQNLIDAGCSEKEVHMFMEVLKNNNWKEELKMLGIHRKQLLEELHLCQKKIECLDYLVYQIRKGEAQKHENRKKN